MHNKCHIFLIPAVMYKLAILIFASKLKQIYDEKSFNIISHAAALCSM